MKIRQLVRLNAEVYLASRKWTIPIFGVLFISYVSLDQINIRSQSSGLLPNAWDMIFSVLGDIYFVSIFILLPFAFIVGDLTTTSNFESHVVLQVGSRRKWWWGKLATVAWAALGYAAAVLGGIAIITSAIFAWENQWSALTLALLPGGTVTSVMLMHSPFVYVAIMVLMLLLGLLTIGILAQTGTLILRSAGKGFLLTSFVVLVGLLAHGYNFQSPLLDLFIVRHLLPFNYVDDFSAVVFGSSLYWAIFIALLLMSSLVWVRRLDFGSHGR